MIIESKPEDRDPNDSDAEFWSVGPDDDSILPFWELYDLTPPIKGGPGSGNFGHTGRPGSEGGSVGRGAGSGHAYLSQRGEEFATSHRGKPTTPEPEKLARKLPKVLDLELTPKYSLDELTYPVDTSIGTELRLSILREFANDEDIRLGLLAREESDILRSRDIALSQEYGKATPERRAEINKEVNQIENRRNVLDQTAFNAEKKMAGIFDRMIKVDSPTKVNVLEDYDNSPSKATSARMASASSWVGERASIGTGIGGNELFITLAERKGVRANAQDTLITVSPRDSLDIHVHELGHAIEASAGYEQRKFRQVFVDHRNGGDAPLVPLKKFSAAYDASEMTRVDKWENPYTGKVYSTSKSSEVISMGLQSMFVDKAKFMFHDPEYFDFMASYLRRG